MKGDPLQGLRVVFCLILKTKLFNETHALTKQGISLGRGTQAESSRGNPGELLCHVARSLGFYGDGVSFWVVSETDSGSLLVVHALFTQVGFQRGGFWEVGRTYGLVSPLSF